MKTITFKVPDDKKVIQTETDGTITIEFANKPKDWTEMETFEEFYEAADDHAKKEYDQDNCQSMDGIAYKKLRLIIRFVNTDKQTGKRWIPKPDEKKWFPIFNLSSGCGFACSNYGCDYAIACVGSRLCSREKATSDTIALKFLSLYTDLITLNN